MLFLDDMVEKALSDMPADIRAAFRRIAEMIASGRSRPTTRTLERFARATGFNALRISFDPVSPARGRPR